MSGDFKIAYESWIDDHKSRRTGEPLRRLEEGMSEAGMLFLENIWWPVVGSFEYLHPEYEVTDFKGGKRYIDFAFIRYYYKIAWEILGFGPHWRSISRWKFSDDWVRHCDLMNDGWQVMYLAYDCINEQEQICRRILQQTLGRLFGTGNDPIEALNLTMYEERLIRRMKQYELNRVSPGEAASWIGVERKAARNMLMSLTKKGILIPDDNAVRTREYLLNKDLSKFYL